MNRQLTEPVIANLGGLVALDRHWQSAVTIRTFEERLLRLFSQAKIFGTVHTCIGQEFTGVAVADSLQPGDTVYSNHRCHGHYLARTGNVDGLMAEIMGRQGGICGGRGGSQHICDGGVYSNGIQGGIVPLSAGLAWAHKQNGKNNIAVVFIGDGTLGEGAVYEAMNIASHWDLPLLIVLENNLYAQSTSQVQTLAGDILMRPQAFGIRAFESSVWELSDLFAQASYAAEYVRNSSRPAFLKIDTYRLMAHSKGDDDRDPAEVGQYAAIDPINRLRDERPEFYHECVSEADRLIDAAVELADAMPFTAPTYASPAPVTVPVWSPTHFPETNERVVARLHAALRRAIEDDERVFCIGEDIEGPYGGAFKVTKNLSVEFPGRVRNTPISEGAIVGISNGLALAGRIPVCEIMFGDFMSLTMDQILNHAAKFRYMYNDQVQIPLILRTPMGGKRGYGATHSQSIEKHFLGIPDTAVLAIHQRFDPGEVYDRLFRTIQAPTIVIENKSLYGQYVSGDAPTGYVWENTDATFPTSRLTSRGWPDVTIVCYGAMLMDVEHAVDRLVDEHEIIPEVICPIQLYPLDIGPIVESARKSTRVLVVEEGQGFCGFGAELAAQLQELLPGVLTGIRRVSASPAPIPSCKPAEDLMLPGIDDIVRAAVGVVNHG